MYYFQKKNTQLYEFYLRIYCSIIIVRNCYLPSLKVLSAAIFRLIIGRIMESKTEEKVEIKNEQDI